MKKIFLVLMLLSSLFGNDDDLDLKLSQDVSFKDGYGLITAYPQNITDELKNKLKFMGEYNVDKNSNVSIRFKRIQYDGRVYDLTEPFEKKLRLKNPQTAKFVNGAKIRVSGGNREEILQIVNRQQAESKAQAKNNVKNQLQRDNKGNDLSSALSSIGRSSTGSSSYYPYTYATTDSSSNTGDYSDSATNSDGSCRSPIVSDGVVSVFATTSTGGACKRFTAPASSIYYKYGEATCKNKIDYESKTISVGREGFVTLDDNKEYKVSSCEYLPTQELKSDLSQCLAIPNYKDKTATIQNQYYFVLENERHNVGGCTTTEEKVPLQEDLNQCTYRHDFVRKLSIKQRQFFYMQGNTRQDVGECVDKDEEGFRFPHYEDNTTCSYDVVDDRVFYQSRLAFTDLTGGRSYATECRVISAGGLEVFEELSGYQFDSSTKTAQRKVNQYFFIPDTQVKRYIKKDVLTNKSYPYQESLCKWEHHDDEKYSLKYSKISFQDTDENKEVIVSKCDNSINRQEYPYTYLGEERTVEETLSGKTLIPEKQTDENISYKIYGTNDYIIGTPNAVFNIQETGLTGSLNDIKKAYNEEQLAGLEFPSYSNTYSCSYENGQGLQRPTTCTKTYYNVKTKTNYGTNQNIQKQSVKETYRRADGTKFYTETKIEWRAK